MVQGAETIGRGFIIEPISDTRLGGPVSLEEAEGLPGVGRGMRLIADIGSTLDLVAVKNRGDSSRATVRVEPQPRLLADPDPGGLNPGPGWVWAVLDALGWWGNAWADATDIDSTGWPWRLPLWPTEAVVWDEPEARWRIGWDHLAVTDVVHFKAATRAAELLGKGVLDTYQDELRLIRAAERAQFVLMNHGVPTGLLKVDPMSGTTQAELNELVELWMDKQRTRKVAALKGVDFQRVSFSADELSMIPTREFNLRLASDITGVPPYLLGVPSEARVYSNAETEWSNFLKTTLLPKLKVIEYGLTSALPRGIEARFDLTPLLRGDAKTRWDIYRTARDLDAMTVDEIRNAEEMGPMPGDQGDTQEGSTP